MGHHFHHPAIDFLQVDPLTEIEEIQEGIKHGVRKVNIDTDLRMAATGAIRRHLHDNPKNFDPRKYLGPAREELIKMIVRKNKEVLGSAGHAWE